MKIQDFPGVAAAASITTAIVFISIFGASSNKETALPCAEALPTLTVVIHGLDMWQEKLQGRLDEQAQCYHIVSATRNVDIEYDKTARSFSDHGIHVVVELERLPLIPQLKKEGVK